MSDATSSGFASMASSLVRPQNPSIDKNDSRVFRHDEDVKANLLGLDTFKDVEVRDSLEVP